MQNKFRIFLVSLMFIAFFVLSLVAVPYASAASSGTPTIASVHTHSDMPPAQDLRLPDF